MENINKKICEALGLNPSTTISVTMEFSNERPSVMIRSILTDEQGLVLGKILEGYHLVGIGEE